jgi:hypothetical protein
MPTFLHHSNIKKELLNLFKEAEEMLFLVSPFIKLSEEMKSALSRKKNAIDFQIVILFGKNEQNLSKSLSREDMEFFKQFQNVQIFYNADLHAKYYGNETRSIVTSLNLHQFSVKNNIEIGIMLERRRLNLNGDKQLDSEIFEYIEGVLEISELVYEHTTNQESSFFGLFRGKIKRHVEHDATDLVYQNKESKPKFVNQKSGFCIRTGVQIPFNIKVPFSKTAYESWSKWKNKDFKEKYCHYSGEASNGETSFAKPVLGKYYREASTLQKDLFS